MRMREWDIVHDGLMLEKDTINEAFARPWPLASSLSSPPLSCICKNMSHFSPPSSFIFLARLPMLKARIKLSVNTNISVIGFYRNIENIGKISVDIFIKISVIKIFHILII